MEFPRAYTLLKLFSLSCLLGTFGIIGYANVGFLHSQSDSMAPYHTFLHLKLKEPQKGDYTVVPGKIYGMPLIKKITGTAGDEILYKDGSNLFVGGQLIAQNLQAKQIEHIKLTPIQAQTISKDKVFVSSINKLSFDSRYQELGLIEVKELKGQVIPLW